MDVMMVYMLFASVTPLFLWIQYKKFAIGQFPFIIGMWVYFVFLYSAMDVNSLVYNLFLGIFIINILYAHIAFYLVFFHDQIMRKRIGKIRDVIHN